jgi:hypothetical protein
MPFAPPAANSVLPSRPVLVRLSLLHYRGLSEGMMKSTVTAGPSSCSTAAPSSPGRHAMCQGCIRRCCVPHRRGEHGNQDGQPELRKGSPAGLAERAFSAPHGIKRSNEIWSTRRKRAKCPKSGFFFNLPRKNSGTRPQLQKIVGGGSGYFPYFPIGSTRSINPPSRNPLDCLMVSAAHRSTLRASARSGRPE